MDYLCILYSLITISNTQSAQPIESTAEPTKSPTEVPTPLTYITCVTRDSIVSDIGAGSMISIGCNEGEVMTSCGFSAISGTDYFNHPGSFVLNSIKHNSAETCTAQNYGQGVRAHARCCSFTPYASDFSCVGYDINQDSSGTQIVSCNDTSHTYLTGCSAFSSSSSSTASTMLGMIPNDIWLDTAEFDTDYPMIQQICSSYDNYEGPPNGGTKATLVCCNSPSYQLNCVTRYAQSTVKCSDGYHMTGCSGRIINLPDTKNVQVSLNAWYISNDNECITNVGSYAIAICCKLETDAPTLYPTASPTQPTTPYPTLNVGSLSPIRSPTSTPTIKIDAEQKEDTTLLPIMTTVKGSDAAMNGWKKDILLRIIWIMTVSLVLLILIVVLLILYKRKPKDNTSGQLKDQNNNNQHITMVSSSNEDIIQGETALQGMPDLPEEEEDEAGEVSNDDQTDDSDGLYDVAHVTTNGMVAEEKEEKEALMSDAVEKVEVHKN